MESKTIVHDVHTVIDERVVGNKTVTLVHYSTKNLSSEFWRIRVSNDKSGMSIPFNSETVARSVFQSHVKF